MCLLANKAGTAKHTNISSAEQQSLANNMYSRLWLVATLNSSRVLHIYVCTQLSNDADYHSWVALCIVHVRLQHNQTTCTGMPQENCTVHTCIRWWHTYTVSELQGCMNKLIRHAVQVFAGMLHMCLLCRLNYALLPVLLQWCQHERQPSPRSVT